MFLRQLRYHMSEMYTANGTSHAEPIGSVFADPNLDLLAAMRLL